MRRFVAVLVLALAPAAAFGQDVHVQTVAHLGQMVVAQGVDGQVALLPGGTLDDTNPPPLPDVVVAWVSEGSTITLNFWQKPGEDDKHFKARVKDSVTFFKELFTPDPPAASK